MFLGQVLLLLFSLNFSDTLVNFNETVSLDFNFFPLCDGALVSVSASKLADEKTNVKCIRDFFSVKELLFELFAYRGKFIVDIVI